MSDFRKRTYAARYAKLIADLCDRADMGEQGAKVLETGQLLVDGVAMTLIHGAADSPETLMLYCDYGDLPDREDIDWHRCLLQLNLLTLSGKFAGALALNPENNRVILVRRLSLDGLNVTALISQLHYSAKLSQNWRLLIAQDESIGAGPAKDGTGASGQTRNASL